MKAKGISVRLGGILQIHTPNGRMDFSPQQLSEKTFNYYGKSIYFFTSNTLYILPYHKENYVEILENSGFTRDHSLYVPLNDELSYPIAYKEKWVSMMKKSIGTA